MTRNLLLVRCRKSLAYWLRRSLLAEEFLIQLEGSVPARAFLTGLTQGWP